MACSRSMEMDLVLGSTPVPTAPTRISGSEQHICRHQPGLFDRQGFVHEPTPAPWSRPAPGSRGLVWTTRLPQSWRSGKTSQWRRTRDRYTNLVPLIARRTTANIVCTETPSQFPDDFKITPLAATAAGDTLTVTPVPVSFSGGFNPGSFTGLQCVPYYDYDLVGGIPGTTPLCVEIEVDCPTASPDACAWPNSTQFDYGIDAEISPGNQNFLIGGPHVLVQHGTLPELLPVPPVDGPPTS